MRVLITSFAMDSHFAGSVPLAWALRSAGHQVLVASQPALTDVIVAAGLTAAPVGEDHAHDKLLAAVGAEILAQHDDRDYLEMRHERLSLDFLKGHETVMTALFYSKINGGSMVQDMVDLARAWRPDLVLWEPFTFAGAIAARACGAAHARLLTMPDMFLSTRRRYRSMMAELPPARRDDTLQEWLAGMLERHGAAFSDDVVTGQWTVDQMPEGVRLELGQPTVPMRFIPYNGQVRSVLPDWLRVPSKRTRVCVTLGMTARTTAMPNMVSVDEVFAAVEGLDAEVVATLSAAEQDMLGAVPANVRLVEQVPLDVLLPTCAAVVHHGGVGTWAAAAALGVPQLSLGHMWESIYRAQRTEALGAGLCLYSGDLTAEGLRGRLVRLLNEPAFTRQAAALRDTIQGAPSPNDVVPVLERLTAEHR